MHIVIGGASGFLGQGLADALMERGDQVTRLVRREASHTDESRWDATRNQVDQTVISSADAVVNLSGATIARWPRTKKYQAELLQSRLSATRTLSQAIAKCSEPPAFLSGSAMGIYGSDRGNEMLTETSAEGDGFLADLCRQWEAATALAENAGARVCHLRTSLVMQASGGMLKFMAPVFKLGCGAQLGNGKQHMSLISRDDWVSAVLHLIDNDLSGPFNLASPATVTNRDFTKTLGKALQRPTFLRAPSPILKLALGALSDDLLGSIRLQPKNLLDSGFEFEHPDLESIIAAALK